MKSKSEESGVRTAFGRYAEELRVARNMTQTAFSDAAGMSLSRISNVENQRSSISDDVVRVYLRVLRCSGDEADKLRKLARFSNELRKRSADESKHSPLQVMFEQFGERISPQAAAKIQKILEAETGEAVASLRFSSNQVTSKSRRAHKGSRRSRPVLTPTRLAEIAIAALDFRRNVCDDMEKLDVLFMLQKLSVDDPKFDFRVLEFLPAYLDGAFACILGHREGHTLLVEEDRLSKANKGVYFARHVIAHEVGHHCLHKELLASEEEMFLAPQELAKNSSAMIGSDREIQQVIDTVEEEEAECFATFLLVPWEAFLKGTKNEYLSSDFGEQPRSVERYGKYFKNRAVLDAFKKVLWDRGERSHPIFHCD